MRYLIKSKLLAWGNDFHICDEEGHERFFVDGRVFSVGNKLSFQDMQGNELAFIAEQLLSWGPRYEIQRNGQSYAIMKKKLFTLFRSKFTVDVTGPDELKVDGNFFDQEYVFTRNGRQVAQVSKKWFSWTDTYGVDVDPAEDDVLILACVIVIAQVCRDSHRASVGSHS